MSRKSGCVRARGNCKPVTSLVQIMGKRVGKSSTAAAFEVITEMSVYPPVSPKEAETFCRIHIKRCNMNLANAKDRGDKRAVLNLERKLAVYEYLYKLAKDKDDEIESTTDCPSCLVHAVGKDGVCACCGYKKTEESQEGVCST